MLSSPAAGRLRTCSVPRRRDPPSSMLYVPDRCTFRTMSLRHAFGHAVSLHKTMSPNHTVFVCAPNAHVDRTARLEGR